MVDRSNWTPEQREKERVQNRLRMARRYKQKTPEQIKVENLKRKKREAQKAIDDPQWAEMSRASRSRSIQKYYQKRRNDPAFWEKRKEYLRRWLSEKRLNEEFDAFVARLERCDAD